MQFQKQQIRLAVCCRYNICVLIFACTAFGSCLQKQEIHPYFSGLFNKIHDSLNYNYTIADNDIDILNTQFAGFAKPSLADKAWYYYYKAAWYWHKKEVFDSTLLYADSCVKLSRSLVASQPIALPYTKALFLKSAVTYQQKDFDESARYLVLGKLSLPENLADDYTTYDYYERMSNLLYDQKRYLQAIKFYLLKSTLATRLNRPLIWKIGNIEGNLDNAGMSYKAVGMTDSAMYFFNAALQYINKQDTQNLTNEIKAEIPIMKAVIYNNQAGILYQLKDTAAAEKLYLLCANIAKRYSDLNFRFRNWVNLTDLYIDQRKHGKAAWALQQMVLEGDTVSLYKIPRDYIVLLHTYSRYFESINQADSANNMLLRIRHLKDSLAVAQALFFATDVSHDIENKEQKAANEKQLQDNKIKNNYLIITMIGAAIAIVFMAMIVYYLKRKSQYASQLAALHHELVQQNNELEKTLSSLLQSDSENDYLVRTVAHDLKNPIGAMRMLAYTLAKNSLHPNKQMLELIEKACASSVAHIKLLLEPKKI